MWNTTFPCGAGLELWEDKDLGTGFLHHRIRLPRPQDAPPRVKWGAPSLLITPRTRKSSKTAPQKNTHKQKKRTDEFVYFRFCFRRFGNTNELYRRWMLGRNPKWKDRLPTISFQVRTASLREGIHPKKQPSKNPETPKQRIAWGRITLNFCPILIRICICSHSDWQSANDIQTLQLFTVTSSYITCVQHFMQK